MAGILAPRPEGSFTDLVIGSWWSQQISYLRRSADLWPCPEILIASVERLC